MLFRLMPLSFLWIFFRLMHVFNSSVSPCCVGDEEVRSTRSSSFHTCWVDCPGGSGGVAARDGHELPEEDHQGEEAWKGGNRFWENIVLGFKTPREAVEEFDSLERGSKAEDRHHKRKRSKHKESLEDLCNRKK